MNFNYFVGNINILKVLKYQLHLQQDIILKLDQFVTPYLILYFKINDS
jgi:hypothetical protein